MQILIFKVLIHSCISHDEFVPENNVLIEYKEVKEEIKKFCGIHYIIMIDTSRDPITKVDNYQTLWLHENI